MGDIVRKLLSNSFVLFVIFIVIAIIIPLPCGLLDFMRLLNISLSQFEKETAAYLADITKEIASAGFTDVILANMRYPAVNPQDYTNFLRQLSISDETARLEALWNVISACQKAAGDTRVTIEMNDEDLFADNNAIALTTAEAAGDKTTLKTAALLVDYSPADKTGYAETRAFIGKLSAMYSGQEWAVRIQTSGFSAASLEQVR